MAGLSRISPALWRLRWVELRPEPKDISLLPDRCLPDPLKRGKTNGPKSERTEERADRVREEINVIHMGK